MTCTPCTTGDTREPFRPRPIRMIGLRDVAGYRLKIYTVTYGPSPIDLPLYGAGLEFAARSLPQPPDGAGRLGVGFVIYHQGRGVHYLVLNWWGNENEYFNRVFLRPFGPGQEWRGASEGESACVWDLEIIWFERNAFVETVLAGPTPDLEGYLARGLTVEA